MFMIHTIIIASITFILITLSILLFPKIKIGKITLSTYWLIALIGAIILLICNFAPINLLFKELTSDSSVNPLKIIILFFSMTILSIFLDELGLFSYLASVACIKAKNNQFTLFIILYLLVSVLTIFTSNDIVILTFTPFICLFAKRSNVDPIPYLVAEFIAANTWSLMFIIGNPTNIYLATSANISFFDYFKIMAIPTICVGIAEFLILIIIFYKKLKTPLEINNEIYKIENKPVLIIGVATLFVCLIFLILSSYINGLEMWIISLISASSLFVISLILCIFKKCKVETLTNSLKKLPYQLIPFFLSMFVVVVALKEQGISLEISKLLNKGDILWTYGLSSFISSNLINNIPMSILFSDLCSNVESSQYLNSIYASIIGSNLGAFLTPMGALAGIMFTNLVNKQNVKYTFVDFIKYGAIISIPLILVALGALTLSFNLI